MLDDDLAGRGRHRDAAADLLQERLQHVVEHRQETRMGQRHVKGRDERSVVHHAGQQRQAGRRRLVDVHDVEFAIAQPAPHPRRRQQAELHPGDRAVVRERHRLARGDDVRRQARLVIVAGGQHRDRMAVPDERLGQVADVRLHSPGNVPRVRADDADAHHSVRPELLQHVPVGRAGGDIGGEHVGQRLGRAVHPVTQPGAGQLDRRVDAATPSRRLRTTGRPEAAARRWWPRASPGPAGNRAG